MSNQEIKVSVCVVTYNQEQYIAECLDSLVNQQTNFEFEIVVGEDCSTDNTRTIVQNFVNNYPNLIVPVFHKMNVGAIENIKAVYKLARGKYIAHLDGDDMAMPHKLQHQYNVMEQNPKCTICSHDVEEIDLHGNKVNLHRQKFSQPMDRFEFIRSGLNFCHSSKFFLNNFTNEEYDSLLNHPKIIDYEIHLASLKKGYYIHLGEVLGKYRILSGISTENKKLSPLLIEASDRVSAQLLAEYTEPYEHAIIKKRYAIGMLRLAHQIAIIEEDKERFRKFVYRSIEIDKFTIEQFIYFMGTLYPSLFFKLLKIRHKLKNSNS